MRSKSSFTSSSFKKDLLRAWGQKLALITIPLDTSSFRDYKCFGISFWLTCLLKTFPCFLLTCTSTILILIFILVFCFYVCVSLLEDKQRVKFGGVMSIFYTHLIPIFWLVFLKFL